MNLLEGNQKDQQQDDKQELIFQLSEAIRSGKPKSMEEFQTECQVRIRRTEDAIKRLCKKHYPEFMQASECMEHFKVGLSDVKDRLKDIQANINDVDKHFYSQA